MKTSFCGHRSLTLFSTSLSFLRHTHTHTRTLTQVVDINDLLDPTTTSISGLSIPSLPSITMPSIVSRTLQPSVDAFSGDLDQMNLSNHPPPSGNMTPKGSSFIAPSFSSSSSSAAATSSSSSSASNVAPMLSQSSVSNIPFSTTSNAPYSVNSSSGMNNSSHGSAHGSVGGGSVRSHSQGSIPMMGFKQDNSDSSRYDGSAQTEGMRRGWNDDETGTETESEIDYGQNNGASGDHYT